MQYTQVVALYKAKIQTMTQQEAELIKKMEAEPANATENRFLLAEKMLDRASYHILLNNITLNMKKRHDDNALSEARQALYNSVISMETLLGRQIDTAFSDYQEKTDAIKFASPVRRYNLVRKMGLTASLVEDGYEKKGRWVWTFVEIRGRIAALAKNMMDIKQVMQSGNPVLTKYFRLVQKLLWNSAKAYRKRYELGGRNREDINKGVSFLQALRRLYIVASDQENADKIIKWIDVWEAQFAKG
jgi:hypothetical protein